MINLLQEDSEIDNGWLVGMLARGANPNAKKNVVACGGLGKKSDFALWCDVRNRSDLGILMSGKDLKITASDLKEWYLRAALDSSRFDEWAIAIEENEKETMLVELLSHYHQQGEVVEPSEIMTFLVQTIKNRELIKLVDYGYKEMPSLFDWMVSLNWQKIDLLMSILISEANSTQSWLLQMTDIESGRAWLKKCFENKGNVELLLDSVCRNYVIPIPNTNVNNDLLASLVKYRFLYFYYSHF